MRTACLEPVSRGRLTFWEAVRSSARAPARFLAHWLSCMAEAWSVMVGTVALDAATILAPGWRTGQASGG